MTLRTRALFPLFLALSACGSTDDTNPSPVVVPEPDAGTDGATPAPEACSLYQKYEYDAHPDAYADCSKVVVPYDDIVPRETAGHMWSRTVPKCIDGTDGPCAGNEIRCLDGTRPFYHVDKAVDANGNPVSADKWVFFFPGGGSCSQRDDESAADNCMTAYSTGGEANEMTTQHANPDVKGVMSHDNVKGILADDPSNDFSGFNRVKIYKCSYDRYSGNRTNLDAPGMVVYFHGRKMIEAVFADLGRSRGVVSEPADGELPSLDAATQILVSGNSGGSAGLIQNADWIQELLFARTNATLKFALDARIEPSLEGESHFENGGATAELYGNDSSGESALDNGTNPVSIVRSVTAFGPGGTERLRGDAWGDPTSESEPYMDQSCVQTHASDPSLCYDEYHVLFHHMSVDRFMYQSLGDANHRNNTVGWVDSWTGSSEPFVWVPNSPASSQYFAEFTNRVVYTVDQFFRFRASSDETPSAPVYQLAIMVPEHDEHVNIIDNHYFQEASMQKTTGGVTTTYTFESALSEWFQNGGDVLMVDDSSTTEKAIGGGWSTSK